MRAHVFHQTSNNLFTHDQCTLECKQDQSNEPIGIDFSINKSNLSLRTVFRVKYLLFSTEF